jgi:hypothetical protein
MEAIDSRLTSAAIRYFGSWRAAVEASGIDYSEVAAIGRQRRAEKITKWTQERILEEIRRLRDIGEDLSSAVVRRKYLPLYATARRKEHFGSWARAVAAAGLDYNSVKQDAKQRRREQADWKRQLLADWGDKVVRSEGTVHVPVSEQLPAAAPDWVQELLKEKLVEVYEQADDESVKQVQERIRELMGRGEAAREA